MKKKLENKNEEVGICVSERDKDVVDQGAIQMHSSILSLSMFVQQQQVTSALPYSRSINSLRQQKQQVTSALPYSRSINSLRQQKQQVTS
ncbi:hypothetical protein Tco_1341801 [Tanacetum coccineum]